MKKVFTSILICIIACMAVCLAGCGNEYAKQEYNDAEKIAQIDDRYSESIYHFKSIDGGYSLTIAKFDGRDTFWKKTLEEDVEVEMQLDLKISSGTVKIVFIDCDNNITDLIECSQDSSNEQTATKTVSFTSGLNRLKIVGYDCKGIDLKILFDEP